MNIAGDIYFRSSYINAVVTAWLNVIEAEIAWKKAVLVAKLLYTLPF